MRRIITCIFLLCIGASVEAEVAEARIHVVEPGEQIGRLAAIYGVPADDILAANPLVRPPLEAGQRIVIPRTVVANAIPVVRVERHDPERRTPGGEQGISPSPPIGTPLTQNRTWARTDRLSFAEAIQLPASANIRYNGRWKPPGEDSAWVMDCSNTVRWTYRAVRGIELPRTASGQYDWLKKRKRLWRVRADDRLLRRVLKPGDLLFWEHTYRPVRKPPITHVMIYLGTDELGRMRMAGSQGARGVDFYTFDPSAKMGGYPFFLFFRREGKFVAYGRP